MAGGQVMLESILIAVILGVGVALLPKRVGAALPAPNTALGAQNETPVISEDLDVLARTVWGEARGEGYAGMQAVANVIMNRYKAAQANFSIGRRWGYSVAEICKKPYQFSVWNISDPSYARINNVTLADAEFRTALEISRLALNGALPDITGGADHSLNIDVTRKIRGGSLPSWVNLERKTASLGQHTFMNLG